VRQSGTERCSVNGTLPCPVRWPDQSVWVHGRVVHSVPLVFDAGLPTQSWMLISLLSVPLVSILSLGCWSPSSVLDAGLHPQSSMLVSPYSMRRWSPSAAWCTVCLARRRLGRSSILVSIGSVTSIAGPSVTSIAGPSVTSIAGPSITAPEPETSRAYTRLEASPIRSPSA
jgi:hypothetical protein